MFVFNLSNLLVAVAFGVVFGGGRCDAAVEGLEAELGMLQWVLYLLSSVNFCCIKDLR